MPHNLSGECETGLLGRGLDGTLELVNFGEVWGGNAGASAGGLSGCGSGLSDCGWCGQREYASGQVTQGAIQRGQQ